MNIRITSFNQPCMSDYDQFKTLTYKDTGESTLFKTAYKNKQIKTEDFIKLFFTEDTREARVIVDELNKKAGSVFELSLVKQLSLRKRSYSYIVQLVDKSGGEAKTINFCHAKKEPVTWFGNGIPNLKNTCFINASLWFTVSSELYKSSLKESLHTISHDAASLLLRKHIQCSNDCSNKPKRKDYDHVADYFADKIKDIPLDTLCEQGAVTTPRHEWRGFLFLRPLPVRDWIYASLHKQKRRVPPLLIQVYLCL